MIKQSSILTKSQSPRKNNKYLTVPQNDTVDFSTLQISQEVKLQKIGKIEDNDLIIVRSQCLGIGGFGIVYKGYFYNNHQIDYSKPLAIKETNLVSLKLGNEESIQIMKDSIKEVELMQEFSHPNIVQYVNVKKTKDHLYLVMEYCNEGDLKTFIKKKNGISESEALYYLGQILDAFRYLNWEKNKMMHRDIKPENILVHSTLGKLIIKLTDFGTAKQLNSTVKSTGNTVGSRLFQSPTVMMGDSDPLVDIWSLGITLYFMLYYDPSIHKDYESRNLPWYTKKVGMLELIEKGLNFPQDTESKIISKESKELISRMLVSDPEQRIKWDELFRHPLLKSNYTSTGKHILFGTMVQYPKISDLPSNDNDYDEVSIEEDDVQQVKESEQNFQKGQLCCSKILHELEISKFMREITEKFFIKNKIENPFFPDLNQDKLNSLIYIINKMAYIFLLNLQDMFKSKKNKINLLELEWVQFQQDQKLFDSIKIQIEHELEIQQKSYEISYNQAIKTVKDQVLLNNICNELNQSKDRDFLNELIIKEIMPEFFVSLGMIKEKIKNEMNLNYYDKNVLSIIYSLLMLYTFDISFSWNSQNKAIDFERFKIERDQDFNQPSIFARIIKAFRKFGVI